ncbi:unnamed protein product [Rotaria sordida]|uniref:Uncharacterized protein n=2 Tax=Rotaria sordida TaxID=392033 RepID=A0A816DMD6_9BILA|nr:unnamed protein product [Rotaria sordida]CAF1462716.1 unnamed protein product [Rotaria sordida]CAF1639309.1 unnamed protein product [Rotaria sordida]
MSDKQQHENHWESHKYTSTTTQIGNQPSVTIGRNISAGGNFDHGEPVATEAHAIIFSDQGHVGTFEYKEKAIDKHPNSIK